jgi:hypothetical protein
VDQKPDYEVDAYLRRAGERDILCDLKLWLPRDPSADGRMEVIAIGVDASQALHDGVTFVSDASVEAAGLRLEAREVLVRSSQSRGRRKAGGARLTIAHVGTLRIETKTRSAPDGESLAGQPKSLQFVLSEIAYGCPVHGTTVDYHGSRTVHRGTSKVLAMIHSNGASVQFGLEQHWAWRNDGNTRVSATSTPVLNVLNLCQSSDTPVEDLTDLAKDACMFLTLAARHLVVVHSVVTSWDAAIVQEWFNPLGRLRARTEEEACGPLISADDVEDYFSHPSVFWRDLNASKRDAIRLAVFAIHPFTERSLEGGFLAMFSSLEGLARRWGQDSGKFRQKVEVLLQRHPVSIGGLWPLFDTDAGPGLYWIRNELAHGRRIGRFADGSLALAHDHLQLWLEHMLLAVIGYTSRPHRDDWLRGQVVNQLKQVTSMQGKLAVAESQAKGA